MPTYSFKFLIRLFFQTKLEFYILYHENNPERGKYKSIIEFHMDYGTTMNDTDCN